MYINFRISPGPPCRCLPLLVDAYTDDLSRRLR